MKKKDGARLARSILPYVATILSASVAVRVRIEQSCSSGAAPRMLEKMPNPADSASGKRAVGWDGEGDPLRAC
jgi:hypothetical protein